LISAHFDAAAGTGQIILRPNRSWTWRANIWLVATLMAISGTVATAFTLQGFWVILPFTVLEVGVLAACLYYCVRSTHQMEVLRLSRSKLVFERGINRPSQRYAFDRYFARFLVEPSRHPWYSKRIELRCRERELEVGRFLGVEDKDQLVRELKRMIHRLDAPSSSA
jgi:uncharacterized membrane protein